MKNVLFLTYYFPPITNSGVFRPLKFVKYLKKHGEWNPIVLTSNPDLHPIKSMDNSISKDIPADIDIHYINSIKPTENSDELHKKYYYEMQIPDGEIGSLMHFVIKGLEIINSQKIDLIFCTIPPFTLSIVGKILKNISGIPLVSDYRDGWVNGDDTQKFRSLEGKMISTYFEQQSLKAADGIISVDQQLGDIVLNGIEDTPLLVIPNGYDADDINNSHRTLNEESTGVINIVWCGYIYTIYENYIIQVIEAIKRLNKQNYNIRFTIAGDMQNKKIIDKLASNDCVSFLGRVDYQDALDIVCKADINLAIYTQEVSVGSKFFNLLLANKHIMAIVNPKNKVAKDFLEKYPYKTILSLETSEMEICDSLEKLLKKDISKYIDLKEVLEKYKEFDREYNTNKLENFFNQILNTNKEKS